MPKLTLYRAITPRNGEYILNHPYKTTQRPPTNVPYFVDNLWEWQRPEEMPCLSKKDVESLFETDPLLRKIKDEMITAIKYWQGVELFTLDSERLPDPTGEIFFEALGGYRLVDM